jgi:hypothetical protein
MGQALSESHEGTEHDRNPSHTRCKGYALDAGYFFSITLVTRSYRKSRMPFVALPLYAEL